MYMRWIQCAYPDQPDSAKPQLESEPIVKDANGEICCSGDGDSVTICDEDLKIELVK